MSRKEEKTYLKNVRKKLNLIPHKGRGINKYWKEDWKDFLKYDFDWDGGFLFDLILYKLEKMRLYFKNKSCLDLDETNLIIDQITECIDLAYKIRADEYLDLSQKYLQENNVNQEIIYERETNRKLAVIETVRKDTRLLASDDSVQKWCEENNYDRADIIVAYSGRWLTEDGSDIWKKMLTDAKNNRSSDMKKFFKLIAIYHENWWD